MSNLFGIHSEIDMSINKELRNLFSITERYDLKSHVHHFLLVLRHRGLDSLHRANSRLDSGGAYDYQRCEYRQHQNYSGYVHHSLLLVGGVQQSHYATI
jgi:hypothetical protein